MSSFNERFKIVFEKAGITQKSLSVKTGLSVASISKYLSNTRAPKPESEQKIIQALGITKEDFYNKENLDMIKKERFRNLDFYDVVYIIKTKVFSDKEKEILKSLL